MRILKHYVSAPILILGVVDVLVLIASVYIGTNLRFLGHVDQIEYSVGAVFPRSLLISSVILLCLIGVGLYQSSYRDGMVGIFVRVVLAFFIGIAGLSFLFYLFPSLFLGRGAFALSLSVAFIAVTITHMVSLTWGEIATKRSVIFLGAGKKAATILEMRRAADRKGFHLLGFIPLPDEAIVIEERNLIHSHDDLLIYVREHQVSEIVVAAEDRRQHLPIADLLECKLSGVDVMEISTFFEKEFGKVRLDMLNPGEMIFSDGFMQGSLDNAIKRIFDILACLLLLSVVWPIMVVTAFMIFLEGGYRGPIFYRQTRVGCGGKEFEVLKFRSMCINAEENGVQWATKNDDRVTRVGGVIRKLRIDELPQVLNVLKGDMSFIGPRPERPEFVIDLNKSIPYYSERHRVKPGISGWAQLRYSYGASENDAREKLQYDLYYVKYHSLFLDLLILLRTVEVVLFGKGAR